MDNQSDIQAAVAISVMLMDLCNKRDFKRLKPDEAPGILPLMDILNEAESKATDRDLAIIGLGKFALEQLTQVASTQDD